MKILLTGAGGFIGTALLEELLAQRHEVTLLSRKPSGFDVPELLADCTGWAATVRGKYFDVCIHLAWIATPGIYLESPENDILADSTIQLAETLFQGGLPHFIGLGTCIEYAAGQTTACSEISTPIAPRSPYGRAKERARAGIAAAADANQAGYTWVRLFYPYGPGEHPNRIPSSFLRTLRANEPLVLKTPDSVKDWIEIRDVTSALIHLASLRSPQCEINLATGVGTRIIDLASIALHTVDAPPSLVSASRGDTDPYAFHLADISKIRATGWSPAISLDAGIERLAAYRSKQPN